MTGTLDPRLLIARCLAPDPHKRFASVPELLAGFSEAFPS